jgi:hypothetical protein
MRGGEALEFIGLQPQEWTPVGLLGLVVVMVLFGWLLPRWTVKEIMKDRDSWKAQATSLLETNRLHAEAAKENTEPAKTVAKVMVAAQDKLGVPSDGVVE